MHLLSKIESDLYPAIGRLKRVESAKAEELSDKGAHVYLIHAIQLPKFIADELAEDVETTIHCALGKKFTQAEMVELVAIRDQMYQLVKEVNELSRRIDEMDEGYERLLGECYRNVAIMNEKMYRVNEIYSDMFSRK